MRSQRYKNQGQKSSDDDSLVVDDSNILTDRSLDETTPPLEIERMKKKKEKRYPFGTALVELLDDRGVIEMELDSDDKVTKKRGNYYNQKAVQVTCKVKLEELPLKINLPMICEPLDWEPINPKKAPKTLADLKGGYLTGRTANISDRYGLLSSKNVNNFRVLLNDEYETLCGIMNTLQKQPFQINEEYLNYIKENYQGRIYRSGILHFHERDLARSLIIFSDPNFSESPDIYEILLTASAFHFKSFKSIADAQEWCRVVLVPALKKLYDLNQNQAVGVCLDTHILNEFGIEDPSKDQPGQLSFVDLAKNAKDPFQFLSSVILILSKGDPSFMYNSPITKDASASAFQIISFLLLDETMARLTNLIPDEKGILHDIYSNMKDSLFKYLEKHLSPIVYKAVTKQMTRKVVKSIFMPKIYGKTYKTTRDDLANKIGNELKDEDCSTVAKLCFDFWKDKYGHIEHFIKLMQNIGWLTSSAGRPILYIIDFFTTYQDYMCSETDRVWVYDNKKKGQRQISFRRPSFKRDTWKSFVATFVNFIHQRDAYIAMQVVLQLLELRIPIYTVHDNFITTPGYSDLIAKCYSNVFYMMESPLSIINKFILNNLFYPLLKRKHPKIEHNEMLIALENAKKEEDEKKKKKTSKFLTKEEIIKYDQEWWELCDLIQLVNPNNVIPLNVLQVVLENNMLVLDPSTGVEWTPAKKNTWKERIASTLKAYEFVTRTICGDSNYPQEGGLNHEKKLKRFKSLLKTQGSIPLTCVHY
ncbi:DNA-dependent RNA polymerase [Tanacetum coccineum]